MAITSKNKSLGLVQFKSSHFRYAIIYVIVTFVVLLFLNIYTSQISQAIFYTNNESAMVDRCKFIASEIAALDVINPSILSGVSEMTGQNVTRMIVTDEKALVIYDSLNKATDKYVFYPEVVQALQSNDVFSSNYHNGVMQSCAASPIISYGTLTGCVYMMEYDVEQGALIKSLQFNIFIISVILEIIVIIFSFFFYNTFTTRLRKILTSMRIIREGDYTHRLKLGGNDELTVLSNEFNDLVKRLEISEQKRNNFVSDASHELKTPLASIKLLSDSILQNQMDIQTAREFVSDIGNEAERLNRMTQKLLSLSRIETQADSDCEIVYIAPTIEKVVRMLSTISEKNQISVYTSTENDAPILILEDDLYQIIFNLVENGIKYNRPNGSLTISVQRQNDNASITFRDTGMGIPEESLNHIFERFYRVDKARARKSGGSGLGLSIVRNLVERNQGKISVNSEVDKGTEFIVEFPIFDVEEER